MKRNDYSVPVHVDQSARSLACQALWQKIRLTVVLLAWCMLGWVTPAVAQNVQHNQNAADLKLRSDLRVNPASHALELQISLGSYPGRGGLAVPITISYSSKLWRVAYQSYVPPVGQSGDGYTAVTANYSEHSLAGWNSSLAFPVIIHEGESEIFGQFGEALPETTDCNYTPCYRIDRILIQTPDGSTHELRSSDQPFGVSNNSPLPNPVPDNLYAVDGSRLRYQRSTQTLFLPDGSRYVLGSTPQYIDRNGNTLTYSGNQLFPYGAGLTDTLGRTIPGPLQITGGTNGDYTYSLPGVGNSTVSYIFKWRPLGAPGLLTASQTLNYIADLGCPPPGGDPPSGGAPSLFISSSGTYICNAPEIFNPIVLNQIVLPTGQAYTFTYNVYGEIDKVVFPTGGYERYEYAGLLPLSTTSGVYVEGNRGITKRYVSANGTGADEVLWQYAYTGANPSVDGTNDPYVLSTIEPNGSLTERYLHRDNLLGGFGLSTDQARSGMAYDERFYSLPDGMGTRHMLRRKLTQWTVTGSNAANQSAQQATRNARVTKVVEILLDTGSGSALAKATDYQYDTTYEFSTGVNMISTKEYDYVAVDQSTAQTAAISSIPVATTLLRTTEKSYDLESNQSYRDRNLVGLVTSMRVKDPNLNIVAQSAISYDEGSYQLISIGAVAGWTDLATTARGNVTTTGIWLNTTGTYLQTHAQYDQCGSVRNIWDAKGHQSQVEYSSTYAYAYPTLTRTPVPDSSGQQGSANPFEATNVFDFNTGLVTSSTDANNVTTRLEYNDALNRPTRMVRAYGTSVQSQTSIAYDDVNRFVTTTSDQSTYDDNVLKSQMTYDGLGRTIEARQYEGGTNYIAVQTEYDATGRAFKTSSPFRPWNSETTVWTTSAFDALGRVVTITTPDSATVTTLYSGNTVTVTDQAGKQRKSVTDGLGRLIQVYEAPNDPNYNYLTIYRYDALDDLINVTQGSQPQRSFQYDSLKRLGSASNPESGTLNYQYDANGNLTQKTDARGVVSTYLYDALNRNYSITYTNDPANTPTVTHTYDGATNGKGKLWTTQTAGNAGMLTTIDSYDALGRPLTERQQFYAGSAWGQPFSQTLSYDRAGHVLTEAYPSERTVTYVYDSAGRMNNFTGNLGDGTVRTYSTGVIYASGGQMTQEQFGTATPVYNKLSYNSRQQLSEILASTTGGDASFNRGKIVNDYSDQCSGAACNGTDNNGNLKKQTVFIPNNEQNTAWTSWNQQYGYDSLNRLTQVHEYTGSPNLDWQQSYNYDRWGNRLLNNNVSASIDANTNRMYAMGDPNHALIDYDNAGNQTKDYLTSNGTRSYDAENRMISATNNSSQTSRYTYDGVGKRVRRNIVNQETWQVYGLGGELLAEYGPNASPSTPQKEYGYRNGQLLITATAPSGLAANNPSDRKTEAVAAASPTSGKESTAGAHSFDLLASIKGLMSRLSGISTTTVSAEAVSDTSTPLFGPSFPYAASLNRSAIPLMPQSGSAKIAFASNGDGSAQIYSMNADGSGLSRLTNDAANDEAPNWSPNNSRIVFQSDRDNLFSGLADVYVMNWDGSGQSRLTSDAADDSAPVWSPDGTRIAFQSVRNGVSYQVYVMNADGSGQINISNSTANDTQPSWSPDGSKIAFASDRDQAGFSSIYVMSANGSNQARLTTSGTGLLDQQPTWSPDGSKLTFTSTRDSITVTWTETDDNGGLVTKSALQVNKEVYVMNANGSAQVRLTNMLENDDSASWSGDGTKIVFRSDRERDCCDPTEQVWVMNPDGTSQMDLSNNGLDDHCPSWQHVAANVPPTASLASPANGATFIAPANITITANASDSDGSVSRVDFYQGVTLIGTAATSPYTVAWNNVAAGSYSLTARAIDNLGATTTSTGVTVTVNANAPPAVNITSPTNGAVFTAPANMTVTASASDNDGTVSRVDFYQGATLIGTSTTSPYAISWNNVAAGSYALTARASDNLGATSTSAPVNITVNAPPTVSITTPTNGASFTAPANITITANASDNDGTIGRVDFYQGTILIGTTTTSPYTISWNNVVAGGYTITAQATDNLGVSTTSNPVNITVGSPPAVNVTTPTNGANFTAPANITITANASASTGSINRVEFYQGTLLIGTSSASPYAITWNNVGAGSYTLKARAIDNSGASTDSTQVNISVNAPPTVSITSPTSGASFTAPANIAITANASDTDGTVSRVDFYQGTTLIGTATASPYSVSWNNVTTGTYLLTAKATDNLGAQTNSTVVNITVITPVADVRWIVTDQLGTPRMIFDQSGSLAGVSRHDYLPFGEDLFAGGRTSVLGYTNSDGARQKFTQKERDNETNLDWFGPGRYYSSTQGRFTSVDPLGASAKPANPQTWNRYSYVWNRPTIAIDPDGLSTIVILVAPRSSGGGGGATVQVFDRNGHDVNVRNQTNRVDGRAVGQGTDRTRTNNDTPFGVYAPLPNYNGSNANATQGGTAGVSARGADLRYGTGIITLSPVSGEVADNNRSGIYIHGGGRPLTNALDAEQPLTPTEGCVRVHNDDINALITTVNNLANNQDPLSNVFIGDNATINNQADQRDARGNYLYPELRNAGFGSPDAQGRRPGPPNQAPEPEEERDRRREQEE